jgi:hypothetical protein
MVTVQKTRRTRNKPNAAGLRQREQLIRFSWIDWPT